MVMASPVRGLRPVRSPRLDALKLPKPVMVTSPPEAISLEMMLISASSVRPAAAWDSPVAEASASMSSVFFRKKYPLKGRRVYGLAPGPARPGRHDP